MGEQINGKIQHVVVLMLENRSFDHIMGDFPGVDGIQSASCNLVNPYMQQSSLNPGFNPYPIDVTSQPFQDFTPDHSFHGMMMDLFGPQTIGYVDTDGPIPSPPTCYPTQTNCGFLHGVPITNATDESPIVISMLDSPPPDQAEVVVAYVQGNTAANNAPANPTWTVSQSTSSNGTNTFALKRSTGNGTYTIGSGTWSYPAPPPFGITDASNTSPIVITTTASSPPSGVQVVIAGVTGNTAANNTPANPTWTVTNISSNTFSLDDSNGSGSCTQGTGTWSPANPRMSYFQYYPFAPPFDPGPVEFPGRLRVLHLLAEQFCLCDQWFCDVPANTVPNRLFMHAATCQGYLDAGTPLLTAKSIYEQLSEYGYDWAMYYYAPQDNRDSIFFPAIAGLSRAQLPIECFAADVAAGNLPFYTFILPSVLTLTLVGLWRLFQGCR